MGKKTHEKIQNGKSLRVVRSDLDFGTSLSWWNGPRFKEQASGPRQTNLKIDDHEIPTSLLDAEVEHEWGAVSSVCWELRIGN